MASPAKLTVPALLPTSLPIMAYQEKVPTEQGKDHLGVAVGVVSGARTEVAHQLADGVGLVVVVGILGRACLQAAAQRFVALPVAVQGGG